MSRTELHVKLNFRNGVEYSVGNLLISTTEPGILFQYDEKFLRSGLKISPFNLPLQKEPFKAKIDQDLYNLHPIFADALPDAWGKRIQDEEFDKIGLYNATSLDRLAFIGKHGMGALTFEPSKDYSRDDHITELANLRKYAQSIIEGDIASVPDELLQRGGSVGGARPKFLIDYEPMTEEMRYTRGQYNDAFRPAILKFPVHEENKTGIHQRVEKCYSEMSRLAGIDTPRTYLPVKDNGVAAFAIERFDIKPFGERLHMHTLAGILGRNFRIDRIDYSDLMNTIIELDAPRKDLVEAYRRMVFNHLAGNSDDHGKNFTFLMSSKGEWSLSPFYDMGYSKSEHHQMSLNGKLSSINYRDLERFAEDYEIDNHRDVIEDVAGAIYKWKDLAKEYEVPKKAIGVIDREITANVNRTRKEMYRIVKGRSSSPEWFFYTFKKTDKAVNTFGLKQEAEKGICITKTSDSLIAWKRNEDTGKFIEIAKTDMNQWDIIQMKAEAYFNKE